MTFLLQTQKLFMSNPWNLTKLIRDHYSGYTTPAALYVESCYCLRKRWSLRVMTSNQLCQVPSIWHNKFLCLQQKCHPQCMFIWSLKGFCSNMFPSGGDLSSLKWGQNEVVKTASEDFENVTIEFYGSNIVYFDIICMIWRYLLISPQIWAVLSKSIFHLLLSPLGVPMSNDFAFSCILQL